MRFSVLPPSYSLVAIEISRSRAWPPSPRTVILMTASEPSSFRVVVTLSMISRAEGADAALSASAGRQSERASVANSSLRVCMTSSWSEGVAELDVSGGELGLDDAKQRVGRPVKDLGAQVGRHRIGQAIADPRRHQPLVRREVEEAERRDRERLVQPQPLEAQRPQVLHLRRLREQ